MGFPTCTTGADQSRRTGMPWQKAGGMGEAAGRSQPTLELLCLHLGVLQNFVQQPWADRFARVNRDNDSASVGMLEIGVTGALITGGASAWEEVQLRKVADARL